jgi:oxygen-independent coproporphyrinogen-3 oxidase
MVAALNKEIQLTASPNFTHNNDKKEIIDTIYFGGGTPSLLSADEIKSLLASVKNHYQINDTAEITLEANPDDISKEKLTEWKNAGINRLSIGVQSFKEKDLEWMNRAHNTKQALECYY